MIKAVYDFNKVRNNFKWDEELEVRMYKEEVKEFFDANTLAERVDALIDCRYVRMGTELKMAVNGFTALPYVNVEWMMEVILRSEINEANYNYNGSIDCSGAYNGNYETILRKATKIVCDANAIKGKVLVDGKVSKEGYSIDATKQIALMIESVMKPEEF